MGPARARLARRLAVAAGLAALAHGVLIVGFAWVRVTFHHDAPPPSAVAAALAAPAPVPLPPSWRVALVDGPVAALPIAALLGPGDAAGAGAHPRPRAGEDVPGRTAAQRGGGGPGGPRAWADRRDRPDDALLRAEPWNGGADYRAAHRDVAAPPRSPEALHRAPVAAAGDRQVRRAGQAGAGGEARAASRDDPVAAPGDDPVFTRAGRAPGAPGPVRATRVAAFADVGAVADDVPRRGPAGDDRAVAASSSQRRPDPFDVVPASAGGGARGVRGPGGPGAAPDGGRRAGTGATRAAAPVGTGGLTVVAAPTDPYFRDFLRRLSDAVVYPPELARDMRSGRVIASFRLSADGAVDDVRLVAPSGREGFDQALLAALRHVGPLGPVPRRLLGVRRDVTVKVPFTFENPLIR